MPVLEVLTDSKHPDRLHIATVNLPTSNSNWGDSASSIFIDGVTPDDCRILIRGITRLKCLLEGQKVTP